MMLDTTRREPSTFGTRDLSWRGGAVCIGKRKLARVVPDCRFPGMWRVSVDEHLSDMANKSRAKDAAVSLALCALNRSYGIQITALDTPPVEQNGLGAP